MVVVRPSVCHECIAAKRCKRSAIVPSDSNYVSMCSGLAAIFNGKFQAISGHISETVRDRAIVTTNP